MSWSFDVTDVDVNELRAKLGEAREKAFEGVEVSPEVARATDIACEAALMLGQAIHTGPTDGPEGKTVLVSASLSGHANPGHEPTEDNWNDTVTVTVTQTGLSKPEASPEP